MTKWQPRKAAQRAVPVMEKCERCGVTEGLTRHHPDYSKPKDVGILCYACHAIADQEDGTRKKRKMQQCEVCGKWFLPMDSHKHKTCSADCLKIRGRENAYKRWGGKTDGKMEYHVSLLEHQTESTASGEAETQ